MLGSALLILVDFMLPGPISVGGTAWLSRAWRDSRRQFVACLILNFIILIPIILNVPLYLDDYARATFGVLGWARDARPLAHVLFLGLNLGGPLVAVSPLYQLGSLFVLSIACVVAARAYGVTFPWFSAMATLPLMGQPYFLANLSFGFDSLSMSLGQLFAVTAAVVLLVSKARASYGIALLLTLATLLTYQPSASSFLSFGLMFSLAAGLGIDRSWATSLSMGRSIVEDLFVLWNRAWDVCSVCQAVME